MTRYLARCLIHAALLCGSAMLAQAEPTTASVPDTMAQRVQACTMCHGKEGRATGEGYFPRIAGKPAGYLYNQLVNFREGRRQNRAMSYLIANMSDAYLMEIAGHFANLDLPYPAVTASAVQTPELARGRVLVLEGDATRKVPACVQCHGQALTGVAPAIPGLLGLPKTYLLGQFGEWRNGLRKAKSPDCMNDISRQLSLEDLRAVVSYLSQLPVPVDSRPDATLSAPPPMECGSLAR